MDPQSREITTIMQLCNQAIQLLKTIRSVKSLSLLFDQRVSTLCTISSRLPQVDQLTAYCSQYEASDCDAYCDVVPDEEMLLQILISSDLATHQRSQMSQKSLRPETSPVELLEGFTNFDVCEHETRGGVDAIFSLAGS